MQDGRQYGGGFTEREMNLLAASGEWGKAEWSEEHYKDTGRGWMMTKLVKPRRQFTDGASQ